MSDTPKFPHIKVQLIGEDGNALVIIGKVMQSLRRNGVEQERIDEFREQATSGDYENVLTTCSDWVTVN